jgi:hypothetical protein
VVLENSGSTEVTTLVVVAGTLNPVVLVAVEREPLHLLEQRELLEPQTPEAAEAAALTTDLVALVEAVL